MHPVQSGCIYQIQQVEPFNIPPRPVLTPYNDRSPLQSRVCLPVQCDRPWISLLIQSSDAQCSSHTKVHYVFKMILALFLPLLEESGSGPESFMGPLKPNQKGLRGVTWQAPCVQLPSLNQPLSRPAQGSLPPQSDSYTHPYLAVFLAHCLLLELSWVRGGVCTFQAPLLKSYFFKGPRLKHYSQLWLSTFPLSSYPALYLAPPAPARTALQSHKNAETSGSASPELYIIRLTLPGAVQWWKWSMRELTPLFATCLYCHSKWNKALIFSSGLAPCPNWPPDTWPLRHPFCD